MLVALRCPDCPRLMWANPLGAFCSCQGILHCHWSCYCGLQLATTPPNPDGGVELLERWD